MKIPSKTIEAKLRETTIRWMLLQAAQRIANVSAAAAGGILLVGLAIVSGFISRKSTAVFWFVLIGFASLAAIVASALRLLARPAEKRQVACMLEIADPTLLDRLNTLVFLERQPDRLRAFAVRIAAQAKQIFRRAKTPNPFPVARPIRSMAAFLAAATVTIWFYDRYSPWDRLGGAPADPASQSAESEKPAELTLPATNSVEPQTTWGEVRITEPGADLKVTKVDVVPLQIEAAASGPLQQVTWRSTVNGLPEKTNNLPPPAEPRYAIYKPMVYLDEWQLADWDVVTYYGHASTEGKNSFASQVYFLEVRPFREDIMKMPGGEGGQAYQRLGELTGLIEEQQRVIRETHKLSQDTSSPANLLDQDRGKLSAAERDLSEAARHLYASMAAEMENKPIGEALDNLAKAEATLDKASRLLGDNLMADAQKRERQALAELVAARKMFQKAVSDNPQNFQPAKPEEIPPVAEDSQKLKEMAEFRDEAKAADQFVEKTARDQENLARKIGSSPHLLYAHLAEEEKQLQTSLQEFRQQHPKPFDNLNPEANEAEKAIAKAAGELEKKAVQARASAESAAEQLRKLSEAMRHQSTEQQLADAYKLKQMLDREIETFGKGENPSAAGASGDQLRSTAAAARKTVDQLQKLAEEPPTRDAFGQPLRDALAPEKKAAIDRQLSHLEQTADEAKRTELAGGAKRALSQVSKAFEQSQPQAMRTARQTDSLKPDRQEAFERGMAELQSLIQRLENKRAPSPENERKQLQDLARNLDESLREPPGAQSHARELDMEVDKIKKGELPIDLEALKRLAAQLQRYSWETSEVRSPKKPESDLTNIDLERLPPAYRARIQKYFQKLSER